MSLDTFPPPEAPPPAADKRLPAGVSPPACRDRHPSLIIASPPHGESGPTFPSPLPTLPPFCAASRSRNAARTRNTQHGIRNTEQPPSTPSPGASPFRTVNQANAARNTEQPPFHPAYRDCCFSPHVGRMNGGTKWPCLTVSIPPTGIVAFLRCATAPSGRSTGKSSPSFHPAYRDCCFSPRGLDAPDHSTPRDGSFHPAYRDCCFSPQGTAVRGPRPHGAFVSIPPTGIVAFLLWVVGLVILWHVLSFHPAYRDCCFSPEPEPQASPEPELAGFHPAYRDCCFSPAIWMRSRGMGAVRFPSRLPGLLLFSVPTFERCAAPHYLKGEFPSRLPGLLLFSCKIWHSNQLRPPFYPYSLHMRVSHPLPIGDTLPMRRSRNALWRGRSSRFGLPNGPRTAFQPLHLGGSSLSPATIAKPPPTPQDRRVEMTIQRFSLPGKCRQRRARTRLPPHPTHRHRRPSAP